MNNWGAGSLIVAIVVWLSLHWVRMYHNKPVLINREIFKFPHYATEELASLEKFAAKRYRQLRHHKEAV